MKNKLPLLSLLACVLLTACASGRPQTSENTSNGYTVSKLVEYDGCTVYRLNGEFQPVYWTRCVGTQPTDTTSFYRSGKTTRVQQVSTRP